MMNPNFFEFVRNYSKIKLHLLLLFFFTFCFKNLQSYLVFSEIAFYYEDCIDHSV